MITRTQKLLICAVVLVVGTASASGVIELSWSVQAFHSEFWFIDQLAGWDEHSNVEPWQKELGKLDEPGRVALKAYAEVRRRHARERPEENDAVSGVAAVLFPPPPSSSDRFASAFLRSKDENAAADALKVTATDRAAITNVFALLRPAITSVLATDPYLEAMRGKFEASAKRTRMAEFLDRMKSFYGHQVSARIIEAVGLFNRRHMNVVEEATQTAIGNILFVRDRLPDSFDRRSFYDYETGLEVPHAIDSLARALEPLIEEELQKPGAFATSYVDRVLAAQKKTLGNPPRNHTHVALVLATSKGARNQFSGMFWGLDRWAGLPSDVDEFASRSMQQPTIARWVFLTTEDAKKKDLLAKLDLPVAKKLRLTKRDAACMQSSTRASGRGYDFYAVGRDEEALRKLIIALHAAPVLPETRPLCVP